MTRREWVALPLLAAVPPLRAAAAPLRLAVLDPGHFHATQLFIERLPGFADTAAVYAPAGPDLLQFLQRVSGYPGWRWRIYAGEDYQERLLAEKPADVVALSGRNRRKIAAIQACLTAGLHVLADKPWIVEANELPLLAAALDYADAHQLIAYDGMTQRFDLVYQLQRALVNDPAVFGVGEPGSPGQAAVVMRSRHYLAKGTPQAPSLRPLWFFDVAEQGEGLADVGTHLADLTHWTLFPEQTLDYRTDFRLLSARRWPLRLSREQFQAVTGVADFPPTLAAQVQGGELAYYCNSQVHYTARGRHVTLQVEWDFDGRHGARDTMFGEYRGAQATITVVQDATTSYVPELRVAPRAGQEKTVQAALERRLAASGATLAPREAGWRVVLPPGVRQPDDRYFVLLAERFFGYVRQPRTMPAWEKSHMLAKYYVTTHAIALARRTEAAA